MGEAVYYLKATFHNEVTAKQLTAIQDFILEGQKAENWWHEHRHWETKGLRDRFWNEFRMEFPLVTELINDLVGKDCDNLPAGRLDFGTIDDGELPHVSDEDPNDILFSARVWHFANWFPLCGFLKSHFGADRAGWLSDEYITNLYNLVEMN